MTCLISNTYSWVVLAIGLLLGLTFMVDLFVLDHLEKFAPECTKLWRA